MIIYSFGERSFFSSHQKLIKKKLIKKIYKKLFNKNNYYYY